MTGQQRREPNPVDPLNPVDSELEAPLTPEQARATRSQGISVGLATGLYGISFGALSVASGLNVLQTMALSLLLFSGGSQFAIVGVLGAGGTGAAAVAASSLLGVRNGLYGLEVAHLLKVSGWKRLVAAHLTIDESTAVGIGQETKAAGRLGFWTTGIAVYLGWNLMTLVGALLGNAIGDPKTYGLDAAAPAAFVALLWGRLKSTHNRITAVLALAIALALSPVTPSGIPVLAATAAALVMGCFRPRPAAETAQTAQTEGTAKTPRSPAAHTDAHPGDSAEGGTR